MVRRDSTGGAAELLATDEAIPEWKRQSVDRSLQAARVRAQARTDRFVAAAMDLMHDQGGMEFTVQQVVERSKMSIRTFYNFFASKDDLLVAVHETIRAKYVVPRLRERCAIHARILWSQHRVPVTADDLWEFCASGLGVEAPKRTTS